MFKARNSDVIDLDKYKAIKRPDSEFKIENVNGVDCVVLDSDNEEKKKANVRLPLKESQLDSVPTSSSMPTQLPSRKKLRQQNLFDSLGIKRKEKPVLTAPPKPTTSKEEDEEKKKWQEIKRRLRSPTFKKNVVQDALLAFDKHGPKKRGPKGNRPSTPEPSKFIKSNRYFKDMEKPAESSTQLTQYGYPVTPPRYWNIDFPSANEQKELGLLVEADSPLFKKRRTK